MAIVAGTSVLGGAPKVAEVRFQTPTEAQYAMGLNGRELHGVRLELELDDASKDMTKVLVHGLPHNVSWQAVKQFFSQAGTVVYTGFLGPGGKTRRAMLRGNGVGEVRFSTSAEAQYATQTLNGSVLMGEKVTVEPDPASADNTKVLVHGVPQSAEWQELKDHFTQAGSVVYAGFLQKGGPGKGGGKGDAEGPAVGEVRFATSEEAQLALKQFSGALLCGAQVTLSLDSGSKDGTKVLVQNLPPGASWQVLREHFSQAGNVVYTGLLKPRVAEVRFESAHDAMQVLQSLQGSSISGAPVQLDMDPQSQDGTKILVHGVPAATDWQEVKDHFSQVCPVSFCGFKDGKASEAMAQEAPTGPRIGEVRFADPQQAAAAMERMQGKPIFGHPVVLHLDEQSKDLTKVLVCGLPAAVGWQMLKLHFAEAGSVVYAGIRDASSGRVGEVRYETAEAAALAVEQLTGSSFKGVPIIVEIDATSMDGTKVLVHGLPPSAQWQDLKDHFKESGTVKYAGIEGQAPFASGGFATGKRKREEPSLLGEVWYVNKEHMAFALRKLHGSVLGGSPVSLQVHTSAKGSCLLVHGLSPNVGPQELRAHFSLVGPVARVDARDYRPGESRPGQVAVGTWAGTGAGKGGAPLPKKGKGGAKGYGKAAPPVGYGKGNGKAGARTGEVRFADPAHAMQAAWQMASVPLGNGVLSVRMDPRSSDGTKISITGIPPGIEWQELKDCFGQLGPVVYAQVT